MTTPTSPSARPVVLIPGGVTDEAHCLRLEGGKYLASDGRALSQCNDDLLARNGLAWQDWTPPPPISSDSDGNMPSNEPVAKLLDLKLGGSDMLVLKDQRLSRLLPYWLAALRSRSSSPRILLYHCDPAETINSNQPQGVSQAQGMLRWLANELQAEADSRGLKRAITSAKRLRDRPDIEAKWLADQLGISQSTGDGNLLDAWEAFLTRDGEGFETCETNFLPKVVAAIHKILDRWAATGEDSNDYPRLDHALNLVRDLATATVAKEGYSAQTCLDAIDILWTAQEERPETGDTCLLALALQREQLRRLERTISALETNLMNRDRELGMVARLLTEAESRYEQLFEDLSKKVWQTNGFGEALSEFVEEVGQLRNRHFGPLREFDRLAKENSELHALVARVEGERRAVLESKTWRMMAPLRHLSSLLKR